MAAGALSRVRRRLPRVKGESARATPSRANSSERSRSGSVNACTLTRCASAVRAWRCAALRWCTATIAASVAAASSATTPASARRRRRCSRSAAVALASRKARSVAPQLVRVAGAPLASDRQARAAVKVRAIAPALLPIGRRLRQVAVHAPALRVGLQPPAQARPFAQQRLVSDLDRGGAQGQQPAVGEQLEDRPNLSLALSVKLGELDAPAHHLAPGTVASEPHENLAGDLLLTRVELGERRFGQPRDRAPHTAGGLVGAWRRRRPSRRCQSSSSALDTSGSAPGSPSTSATIASTSSRSTARPARAAGRSIARRSSCAANGPTSTWLAESSLDSAG